MHTGCCPGEQLRHCAAPTGTPPLPHCWEQGWQRTPRLLGMDQQSQEDPSGCKRVLSRTPRDHMSSGCSAQSPTTSTEPHSTALHQPNPHSPQGMPQQLCSPSLPCPSGRNISAQEWPQTAFVMLQQKQHSSLILLGHLQKAIRSSALPTPRSSQSHPCSCSPPANRGKEFQFAPEHGEPCRQRMCWGREALMGSGTVQGLKRQFWLKTSFCSDLSCECAFFPFSC